MENFLFGVFNKQKSLPHPPASSSTSNPSIHSHTCQTHLVIIFLRPSFLPTLNQKRGAQARTVMTPLPCFWYTWRSSSSASDSNSKTQEIKVLFSNAKKIKMQKGRCKQQTSLTFLSVFCTCDLGEKSNPLQKNSKTCQNATLSLTKPFLDENITHHRPLQPFQRYKLAERVPIAKKKKKKRLARCSFQVTRQKDTPMPDITALNALCYGVR